MANSQNVLSGGKHNSPMLSGAMPPIPQTQDQQQSQPMMPAQAPAPSHGMTVATLRHFQAIMTQLKTLLTNPELGKTDQKSNIIDGVTKLVADRMMAPNSAVQTLATVPDRPFEQRAWAIKQMQQASQARDTVLAHHAAAFAGQGPQQAPDIDGHMAAMNGVMQQYSGQQQ